MAVRLRRGIDYFKGVDFEMRFRAYAKRHALPAFMAMVILALLYIAWPGFKTFRLEHQSPEEWYEVTALSIPNFQLGTNTAIEFDRVIHKELKGSWIVEVQDANDAFANQCSGSGGANYSPEEHLPSTITFDWFVGGCWQVGEIKPSTYRLEVRWDFCEGTVCKTIIEHSNNFDILPPD